MEANKQGFFKETQVLVEEYVKERLLLLKLQTAERVANMAASLVAAALIAIFLLIVIMLLSLLGCYFFTQLTGSWYYGIGIVALFYVIVVLFLIYFRKALLYRFVSDTVIKMFFEETDNIDDAQKT